MEYTLYLEPQFPELKKPKQDRNIFIESSKELRFITAVLEDFSFFFYVSTTLLSYKHKHRADNNF